MSEVSKAPVCVTDGGPCSGKDSLDDLVAEMLPATGWRPLFVRESPTELVRNGLRLAPDPERGITIGDIRSEQDVIELQDIIFGDLYTRFQTAQRVAALIRRHGEKAVILGNRHWVSQVPYYPKGREYEFDSLLSRNGLDRAGALAAVDHLTLMVTAADGAEPSYNLDNRARRETPEQARELDKRTREAWNGHESVCTFANRTRDGKAISFDQKLGAALASIHNFLGVPAPLHIQRKFLLPRGFAPESIPSTLPATEQRIVQDYLTSLFGVERRLRLSELVVSGVFGGATYSYVEKQRQGASRTKMRKMLASAEYHERLRSRDSSLSTVVKRRLSCTWNYQYLHFDFFTSPRGLVLMEVDLTTEQDTLVMPDFVAGAVEVTDDVRYSNYGIAAGLCPGYER
jgi:CYTH domain-containing protein